MSYDIYLEVDSGGPELVEVVWLNHTSNTAGMWRAAGLDLAECDGRSAAQIAEGAAAAVAAIEADPAAFKQYEPMNGWGTVETTLNFLTKIRDACIAHPKAVMRVSR